MPRHSLHKVISSAKYEVKCEKTKVGEDDFQTPSLLPMGSSSFRSIIIRADGADGSDMLFSLLCR
jgi:hypothetical protein